MVGGEGSLLRFFFGSVFGERSNDGTIEVVGGGGLIGEICFVVGFVGILVSRLDVDT